MDAYSPSAEKKDYENRLLITVTSDWQCGKELTEHSIMELWDDDNDDDFLSEVCVSVAAHIVCLAKPYFFFNIYLGELHSEVELW